jgi:two-component system sensor histidine kinase KdpD
MTRLESGAVAPKLEPVDLPDLVGSALNRAAKVLARHRLEVDLGHDLPPIRVDPVLFEQVLFNLLDNAAKYSSAGSRIEISAALDGTTTQIRIADEGVGIPPNDVERIFDKFYRAEASDRRRAGTGLGLPICRGFIEAMGGSIRAANRSAGKGAVFTIAMPVADEQARERAA